MKHYIGIDLGGTNTKIGVVDLEGNLIISKIIKTHSKQKVDKKQDKANEKFLKEMEDFRMEAVIRTTKGDINVFLYPEAAPKNVANRRPTFV